MDSMLSKITKFQRRMKNIFDVFEGRRPRVLLLGLDGAGKTTLLYKSKLDDTIYANVPPRGINIEHMTPRRGAGIQVYDMTGNKVARLMWQQWYRSAEAIVYVVDSADKVRVDEAKFELHELLTSRDVRKTPLIVVANKQDAEDALSPEDITRELELDNINDRDWSIFGVSATKGTGVSKLFKDVVDKIKAYRHYKSGLQTKPVDRRSSKRSTISEKSEETKSISNCSSIEEPVKVKSLFESIKEGETVDAVQDIDEKDNTPEETSRVSDQGSDESARYDKIVGDAGDVSVETDADSGDADTDSGDAEDMPNGHYEDIGDVGDSYKHRALETDESVEKAFDNKTYDSNASVKSTQSAEKDNTQPDKGKTVPESDSLV